MAATSPLIILVDTREQLIPPFPEGVVVEMTTLHEGDYTTRALDGIAVVERKSESDFTSSLTWGRERFERELERLRTYRWKAIVIEGDLGRLIERWQTDAVHAGRPKRGHGMHPYALVGSIASLLARWDCPALFVGSSVVSGRLIAGLLRRWQERLETENEKAACAESAAASSVRSVKGEEGNDLYPDDGDVSTNSSRAVP